MKRNTLFSSLLLTSMMAFGAQAAVTPEEAAQLKTALTPLGAEKAGNKDGAIPAWTGGDAKPTPGFVNGGKRPDPFAGEKPLFTITAQNMDKYADKLSEGIKAMLKKYPDTYHLDVYPTHRTAAAPQWVYDNTFVNATKAKIVNGSAGPQPEGAYGGTPFPIPKTGAEVMWNHLLRWRGASWHFNVNQILISADGTQTVTVDGLGDQQMPYYFQEGAPKDYSGDYWLVRLVDAGPPLRAGEAILGRENMDEEKTRAWVYLTGQRRVRKLPNACCDTPTPSTAGVMTFDELEVFTARLERFNWNLIGKQELYIPYNSNRFMQAPASSDVLGVHHLKPDAVRWELHRVWVVEATLAEGQRHQYPKARYYIDEDSWIAVLGDRWDADNHLSKVLWAVPIDMPDVPAQVTTSFGFYDLMSSTWFAANIYAGKAEQYKIMPRYEDTVFTPEALAGEGVR